MNDLFFDIWKWIKNDFNSYPFRFAAELLAWFISIGCSIIMAFTVPDPPLMVLYPMWITACAVYTWAAYTRKSFGMLANYVLLTTIDTIGLARMIF